VIPSRLFAQLEKAGRKLFEKMATKPNQTARYGDVRQFEKAEAAKPE
jgi:hypothetical protein